MDEKANFEPAVRRKAVVRKDWTEKVEKDAVRKLDMIVLPLLMVVFFTLQLDRANAGNALTDGFLKDIGISQNEYNVGTQLLYVGIIVLEIPSNLVLYRFGPSIWIGGQCIAWGLVAIFQAFQHGLGAFYATRLLLGLCEAGFIPGALFTLSLWYKNSELSKRFAFLFFANGIASASGGLIAYGLLRLRGVAGLAGWQWLFIVEGIITVTAGVVFLSLFPGTPRHPVSLTGLRYFSSEEVDVIQRRVIQDDPSKAAERENISRKEVVNALSNWRAWPHFIITIVGLAPTNALWSYMPTIIASFGYDRLRANAMSSVAQWISAFLVLFAGYIADKTNRRGLVVLGCVLSYFIFMITFTAINKHGSSSSTKYAILTLGAATCSWWHSVNGSWLSLNARSPGERSITMAMFIMSANLAGVVGGFLFRADDKPHYLRGWSIISTFISLALALVVYLNIQYALLNRNLAKSSEVSEIHGQVVEECGESELAKLSTKKVYNF